MPFVYQNGHLILSKTLVICTLIEKLIEIQIVINDFRIVLLVAYIEAISI